MIRFRFPIPAKLLAGLLGNLALLGIGFLAVFRAQFGSGSNELFTAIAGPRVQAAAQRIGEELRSRKPAQWDEVLASASRADGIEYSLFDGAMLPVAGPLKTLPGELQAGIRRAFLRGRRPPRPFEEEAPPGEADFEIDRPPPRFREFDGPPGGAGRQAFPPPPPPPHRPDPEPAPIDSEAGSYPKMTARTSSPSAYWVLSMVPVVAMDRGGYLPLVLVMRSDSLTGHGVFFDPKPWVLAGLGVLLVSALIWVPLAAGLTSSLWRIGKATSRIAEGDFAVSLPDASRGDELGDLGRSVQAMAQRLESHVSGQKRFLGDIAHELCSPISRLQAAVGILEDGGGSEETRERYLRKIGAEVRQMSALVNELLSFSKAGLHRKVNLIPLGVLDLVREVMDREELSPEDARIDIPASLEVMADPEMLARALGNLIRNARRYAGASGAIEIHGARNREEVILRIGDHGPGVAAEALPKLFDPFFRPDASRSRESGGTGLGLAIVKTCVEGCGGTVTASLRVPSGLEMTIRFPDGGKTVGLAGRKTP